MPTYTLGSRVVLIEEEEEEMFIMPTREKLEQTACELLFELFGDVFDETETEVDVTETENDNDNENTTELSFKQRMKKKIVEATVPTTSEGRRPTKKSLQSEMSHYENTGQRGEYLEKLFLVLKNIAPTSVSSEQAFSVAGSFVPSRRSRLSDISIDDLCFEKDYFDNNGYLN